MKDNYKKVIIFISTCIGLSSSLLLNVNAMHIAEGYLPPLWCIAWFGLSFPFLVAGFFSLRKIVSKDKKNLILLALCGSFAFVLSALKLPSITGSSSHPTGIGLGSILFGPMVMSIISVLILVFQALLLAHGGITTLGANVFSMGIAGPIVSYITYKITTKLFNSNKSFSIFLASFLGNLSTYVVTSVQLALAYPDNGSILTSSVKFLSVFALTQIPLAICEGILTVVIFGILDKYALNKIEFGTESQ